ncbi:uncharacterized protein LOC103979842 [Musa acuminata AAA Group]|uniref:uncharacterized protein LOC103979842 n=1 Tax=Musa acuminata AAA Group TaxID=214697 RepID=UPI0031D1502B
MTMSSSNSPGEEGDEEEFFESLDRILSSSCSSTSASASASASASDDESSAVGRRRRARLRFPSLSSLDVWFSAPASVEERRRRLLRHLGLAGDPAVASPRRGGGAFGPSAHAETARSVSCDGLCPRPNPVPVSAVTRSRSDGSAVPGHVNESLPQQHHQGTIRAPFSSNPALDARFRSLSTGILEVSEGDRRIIGGDLCDDPRCLIKNLDNGSEFVVEEFYEDGMWNTLSEVGTGRQLTMEEFDRCVGRCPIVQELMRRQNVEEITNSSGSGGGPAGGAVAGGGSTGGIRFKKRGSWLRSIKNVAGTMVAGGHSHDRKSSDEKDSSSEKGGRRSSSATDDSLDASHGLHHGLERIKVRQYGKSQKELSGLCMCQEIQAHNGSIWSIKFSLDGQYLASAGEDCVIHVWKVSEIETRGDLLNEKASPENEGNHWENNRARVLGSRKSVCSDPFMVPKYVFALSDKPLRSFQGHLKDVLDLSWSKSQYLLSSSMDKTVRLWHMSNNSCLKVFSHSDYVTCIQFNPIDDRYFISGSLDDKVRIWSIPDRQVVDWNDLHEMVTAVCYTPDGQGALVGSHRGNCYLYETSDNKLLQKSRVDLQNRKRSSRQKKITGFQFAPGSPSKVLITSADSRIRVIDGDELVHKFKGFRNTSSQISACLTTNGKHVICASEDSHVYVWRHDDSQTSRRNGVGATTITHSYEYFHCQGVTVAVPWPNTSGMKMLRTCSSKQCALNIEFQANAPLVAENNKTQQQSTIHNSSLNRLSDRNSATWPEELMTVNKQSPGCNGDFCNGGLAAQCKSAWGLVIVTAGQGGEIRTFQKFWLAKPSTVTSTAL